MSNKIHLVMPMAGEGSRFYKNGYKIPKPLIEINGFPFFYWAALSITKFVEVQNLIFVVLRKHIDEFGIDKCILRYFPDAVIEIVPYVLNGPVLTCLEGIKNINDELPVLFNDCDHMFLCSQLYEYLTHGQDPIDGGLVTFSSDMPQYSYIRYGLDNEIIGTVEKQVVSGQAICGAYYFKNAAQFKEMSELYLDNCEYQEYFVSGVYNIMCEKNCIIKSFLCDQHVEFGTPLEYENAKNADIFTKFKRGI